MAIVIIWILSMVLAIPNLFFFHIELQVDKSGEGHMQYCTTQNVPNITTTYIPILEPENENHTSTSNYIDSNTNTSIQQ